MSHPTGSNPKARGEWSGWLLAAVCALLLTAPAQSTPLTSPASGAWSCQTVLAWLQSGGETSTLGARREAVLQALCEAGAFNRHQAETLLASLQTASGVEHSAVSSPQTHSAQPAFGPPAALVPAALMPRPTLGFALAEYSLSPHAAAYRNGVRTNRWLK
jgi:hypothetical protein